MGWPMLVQNLDKVLLSLMGIMWALKALCEIIVLKSRGGLNHEHKCLILTPHSVLGCPEFLISMHLIFWLPHSMSPNLIILIRMFLCQ